MHRRLPKRPFRDDNYDSDFPSLNEHQPYRRPLTKITLVILKTMSNPNFTAMKIAERTAIMDELIRLASQPRESEVLRGGDHIIHPVNGAQKSLFLNLSTVAGREISCSLPKSATTFKGVVRGVPTGDSEEENLDALRDQEVVDIKRLTLRDADKTSTSTIVLSFSSNRIPPPPTVSYQVKEHFPNTIQMPHVLTARPHKKPLRLRTEPQKMWDHPRLVVRLSNKVHQLQPDRPRSRFDVLSRLP